MRAAALLAALLCWFAATAAAQSPEPSPSAASPLERRVSIRLRDIALRDALDRIAAKARIRLSYSAESVPLDRRVSVSRDSATVDAVLAELLRDLPLQAVPVASDHVVLTPRALTTPGSAGRSATVLDRVVVTGSVIAASERPLPVALDVVRGRDAERHQQSSLSNLLDGSVPGVWLWEQAPSSLSARYGSIRGASSFGLSYPKVYVDGIEVANPLLFTEIAPEIVDRVEVIRGPQGAALYGSDAISGVVNVVSRHDGTAPDGTHLQLRSEGGYSLSAYAGQAVPVQEHSLTLRTGSNLRSGGITIGGGTTGDYVPQAYSREIRTLADTRLIGSQSTFTASARFYAKNAGVPANPLLAQVKPRAFAADSVPQELRLYAMGSTLTVVPTERWTYTMTAGLDGYRLANASNDIAPIPSAADTALRDAGGSATRLTMRANGVTYGGDPARAGATLTLGAEHSVLRDRTASEMTLPGAGGSHGGGGGGGGADDVPGAMVVRWGSNTGVSAQLNTALRDQLFLVAGIRGEHIGDQRGLSQDATLPMLGAAFVRDAGPATLKLRGAYGKGIRAVRTSARILTHESRHTFANPNLKPEEQAGTEAGLDLLVGRAFGLHLTRFDQLASGLIQTTVTVVDSNGSGGSGRSPVYGYQLQNVGEIMNRGWEAQATVTYGPVSLASAGTVVSSRVRRLAAGYTGDLRPGDRMLAVPNRTLSVTASLSRRALQASTTVARAWDWINYDRLAIARALLAAGGDARNFTGARLRQYWAQYPGATRLRGSLAYDVWHGTLLTLAGENLLNHQTGEPDSITIVPGRTVRVGVRTRF